MLSSKHLRLYVCILSLFGMFLFTFQFYSVVPDNSRSIYYEFVPLLYQQTKNNLIAPSQLSLDYKQTNENNLYVKKSQISSTDSYSGPTPYNYSIMDVYRIELDYIAQKGDFVTIIGTPKYAQRGRIGLHFLTKKEVLCQIILSFSDRTMSFDNLIGGLWTRDRREPGRKVRRLNLAKFLPIFTEPSEFNLTVILAGHNKYRTILNNRDISIYSPPSVRMQVTNPIKKITGISLLPGFEEAVTNFKLITSRWNFTQNLLYLQPPPIQNKEILNNHVYEYFVGVLSTPDGFSKRQAIRSSWWSDNAFSERRAVGRFFLAYSKDPNVNKELQKESDYFSDIILLNYTDEYRKIARKTLEMVIMVATKVKARYLVKTDDDTFMILRRVSLRLNLTDCIGKSIYIGSISYKDKPHWDNPEHPWYLSKDDWPFSVLPPYAHGPGYIVSSDICKEIYDLYINTQYIKVLPLEDVAMAVWIYQVKTNKNMTIETLNDNRFRFGSGCKENMINGHYFSELQMAKTWEQVSKNHARFCKYEYF